MTDEDLVLNIACVLFLFGGMACAAYVGRNGGQGDRGKRGKPKESSSKVGDITLQLFVVLALIALAGIAVQQGKATWQHVAYAFGGWAVFSLGVSYWNHDKDGARLADVWRSYATKHGDRVDAPRRYAFLSPFSMGADQVTHAKLKGVRHGVEFEADVTSHSPEEISEKGTSFHASPAWMPKGGGVTLSYGPAPESMGVKNPAPTLERHGVCVYAEPPALAGVFQTAEGDRALLEFSKKLPPGLEVTAFRRGKSQAVAMIVTFGWCDQEKELDDTIEVLTRICTLRPPADTFSLQERS